MPGTTLVPHQKYLVVAQLQMLTHSLDLTTTPPPRDTEGQAINM